ncbi:MAG: tRNA-dihydrouridine synthase [Patescibacteria group bacterium]
MLKTTTEIHTTNFWKRLPRPFLVCAPMADGTDPAFRRVIAAHGRPDVMYTEFVSCDGLCSEKGRPKLLRDLSYAPNERPIVAQIFSSKPDNVARCAALILSLGFDGIDINMGCPDRGIEKQGAGAALIKNPALAVEVIQAAQSESGGLPVSIKTRLGYNTVEIDTWLPTLLTAHPDAITLHLRTRKEMSKVPARWDLAVRAVELARGSGTLIIGNGDVASLEEARTRAEETGVDGIMVGRAWFGNPWFGSGKIEISDAERIAVMRQHLAAYVEYFGPSDRNTREFHGHEKHFAVIKKHLNAYLKGVPSLGEVKSALMLAKNAVEAERILAAVAGA